MIIKVKPSNMTSYVTSHFQYKIQDTYIFSTKLDLTDSTGTTFAPPVEADRLFDGGRLEGDVNRCPGMSVLVTRSVVEREKSITPLH